MSKSTPTTLAVTGTTVVTPVAAPLPASPLAPANVTVVTAPSISATVVPRPSVEKKSGQQKPKTSRRVKTQPNKQEEQLDMQKERRSRYMMTINRSLKDKSQLGRKIFVSLIAVSLVIALIVSVVVVIIYSPMVSSEPSTNTTEASLLLRIQQLEITQGTNTSFKALQELLESLKAQVQQNLSSIESLKAQFQQNLSSIESLKAQVQTIQGTTNHSFVSLQESLESLEAQVQQLSDYNSSQFLNVQNSVQNLSLVQNNIRQDLDRLSTMQQTTNHSFVSLQESLESLEAQVQQQSDYNSSQFLNVQNSVQNLSLVQNNIRQDLDRLSTMQQTTNHSFVSLQESLESLEAQVQQQSDYNSSQFLNVQNLSLVQNNIRQDLDILRNIGLYDGCFQETSTCTISLTITALGGCTTDTLNIADPQYFVSSIWCDFSYIYLFPTTTFHRNGNDVYCHCRITSPSATGHDSVTVNNAVCTLTVTKCPNFQNLLN